MCVRRYRLNDNQLGDTSLLSPPMLLRLSPQPRGEGGRQRPTPPSLSSPASSSFIHICSIPPPLLHLPPPPPGSSRSLSCKTPLGPGLPEPVTVASLSVLFSKAVTLPLVLTWVPRDRPLDGNLLAQLGVQDAPLKWICWPAPGSLPFSNCVFLSTPLVPLSGCWNLARALSYFSTPSFWPPLPHQTCWLSPVQSICVFWIHTRARALTSWVPACPRPRPSGSHSSGKRTKPATLTPVSKTHHLPCLSVPGSDGVAALGWVSSIFSY